jgi:hypothetical protein
VLNTEPTPTTEEGVIVDGAGATGTVTWILRDESTGEIKQSGVAYNTITRVGDQRLGEGGALPTPAVGIPNGMKLGTGTTAAGKTGAAAAAIASGTYLADSHIPFSVNPPASSLNGALRQIRFTGVWAAGKATTAGAITEAVIVNDYNAAQNVTSPEANTLSRVILTPAVGSKGAQDSLTLIWDWNVGT